MFIIITIKENNHFATIIYCEDLVYRGRCCSVADSNERNYNNEASIRARNKVLDYAFNNKFSHFITLTIDDKKADWHDKTNIVKKITKQFNNFKNRYDKNFKYILIPEYGDSIKYTGRLHFHGLIYTENNSLLTFLYHDFDYDTNVFRNEWFFKNLGANQFINIRYDNGSVGKYICKYMGKQLNQNFAHVYDRYYFCSKGLKESARILDACTNTNLEYNIFERFLFDKQRFFQNNYCTKFEIDKYELEQIKELINKNETI